MKQEGKEITSFVCFAHFQFCRAHFDVIKKNSPQGFAEVNRLGYKGTTAILLYLHSTYTILVYFVSLAQKFSSHLFIQVRPRWKWCCPSARCILLYIWSILIIATIGVGGGGGGGVSHTKGWGCSLAKAKITSKYWSVLESQQKYVGKRLWLYISM